MPRSIQLSVPPEKADAVLRSIQDIEGVVGLARQRGMSLQPCGDIVLIQTTNDATREVLAILDELGVTDGGSVVTSEPRSMISPDHQDLIDRESNETIWDEMAFLLRQDTNLAPNYLALMSLAGAIAAAGLWTDTLHIVIGSMVIAPAFEPLVRIPFGFISGPKRIAVSGMVAGGAGYLLLALGAVVSALILQAVDSERSVELGTRSWVQFWSTVTPTGVVASTFAAAAGAVVISGQRSVLTTGVMIALALIPSMAIVGMGISVGDFSLAAGGFVRWAVDVALVVVVSALVLSLKRLYLHRHRALS
jgi:hypothetical protein